jgi:glycolate oxidase FAD binding subunit
MGEVVRPGDTAGAADVVRAASSGGRTVCVRGAGTKAAWGALLSRVDVWLDTTGIAGIVRHEPGDRVVTVRAGTPLGELQAELSAAGQCLAVSSGFAHATVGGVLACNEAGPSRLRHGTPRDLVLGVEFVRADGVVGHAGGRVVKNVAGYDLGRLLCGSYGTLGVITQATLRLHPIPPARAWVVTHVDAGRFVAPGPGQASLVTDIVTAVQSPAVAPSAVECDLPGDGVGELAVLVEGTPDGVGARSTALRTVLRELRTDAEIHDQAPSWWGRYPFGDGETGFKVSAPIDELAWAMAAVRARLGAEVAVRGSVAAGVVHAGVPPTVPLPELAQTLAALRSGLTHGSAVVVTAPLSTLDALDVWGPVAGLELMRRIKERFDPGGRFAAGRFVGGI